MEQQNRREVLRDLYQGCLLGGAIGDALGYPVEFMDEREIFQYYGKEGIQTLSQAGPVAKISDDTQMTLFAANGIVSGLGSWNAYMEWLGTQGNPERMDPKRPKMWLYERKRLHSRRAPGSTCLTSLLYSKEGGTMEKPENGSKGCGTVMRAAPFGLGYQPLPEESARFRQVCRSAMEDAALTHGNPTAWYASAVLAGIVYNLATQRYGAKIDLGHLIMGSYQEILKQEPQAYPLVQKLVGAVNLAARKEISDQEAIHRIGEGWVADEALAIAVFCAYRYQNDPAKAIRTAANHRGDSDSTAAICGNIMGARVGAEALTKLFNINQLELADVVLQMADDLFRFAQGEAPKPWEDREWDRKYRRVPQKCTDAAPFLWDMRKPMFHFRFTWGTMVVIRREAIPRGVIGFASTIRQRIYPLAGVRPAGFAQYDCGYYPGFQHETRKARLMELTDWTAEEVWENIDAIIRKNPFLPIKAESFLGVLRELNLGPGDCLFCESGEKEYHCEMIWAEGEKAGLLYRYSIGLSEGVESYLGITNFRRISKEEADLWQDWQ